MRVRVLLLAAALVVALAEGAGAASSVASGWWASSPLVVAPDVSGDQLLVQGGADPAAPAAYAGVRYALATGETPAAVELRVAGQSATTPNATLRLCRLTGPLGERAPGFDCADAVTAAPSGDGTTYQFDVTAFAAAATAGGSLDLAVLPSAPTDRVVLVRPRPESLRSTAPTAGTEAPTGAPPSFDTFSGSAGVAPLPSFTVDTPLPPGTPAVTTTTVVTRLVAPAASTRPVTPSGGGSLAPFVFAALAALAAGLWTFAGNLAGGADPAPAEPD